jgi:hypothetical protein
MKNIEAKDLSPMRSRIKKRVSPKQVTNTKIINRKFQIK